jgi:hypothetical protein
MGSQRVSNRSADAAPTPVGRQPLFNPKLSRRSFLMGSAATPLALEAALASESPVSWDLEFDLSADGSTLTVREFATQFNGGPASVPPTQNKLVVAVQSKNQLPDSDLQDRVRAAILASLPKIVSFEHVRIFTFPQFPRDEVGMRKTQRAVLRKKIFEQIDSMT